MAGPDQTGSDTGSDALAAAIRKALAVAEEALKGDCATSPAGEDAFAALEIIRDTLAQVARQPA